MIQDSGERREFDSGAVRDISEGKGRCDLLPLLEIAEYLRSNSFNDGRQEFRSDAADMICALNYFIQTGNTELLLVDIRYFARHAFGNDATAILELSIHYEEGLKKYGERNWEKGIPCHSFVDSAIRHLLKWCRGDADERHDRAVLWNLFGLLWTIDNKPEYNDLPYVKNLQEGTNDKD